MFGKGGGGGKNAFGGGVGNGRYPLTHPLQILFINFLHSPQTHSFKGFDLTHPLSTLASQSPIISWNLLLVRLLFRSLYIVSIGKAHPDCTKYRYFEPCCTSMTSTAK